MAAVPLATLTAGVQQHQRWPQVTPIVALILARPLAQHPGEIAEDVDASELFEAAEQVFKQGAKDCNLACPGHQYTAVDPMDINSMLGINECGDDEATASPGT